MTDSKSPEQHSPAPQAAVDGYSDAEAAQQHTSVVADAAPVEHDAAQAETAPAAAEPAPAAAPEAAPAAESQRTLSTFMKVSIGILTAVTLASIALLFIGDFEGKFERVFSTITLFAVFVLLTAFDTRRERKNEWYAPVALIANTYILGLLLLVIWVTPYDPFDLQWTIFWKSVFVIVTTRLVTFGMGLLLNIGQGRPDALSRWGQITSLLGILSLIMFTAPVGIDAFTISIPDMYWRFAVATLILTALGLAITLLLRWYYRSDDKPAKLATQAPQAPQTAQPVQQVQTAPAPAPAEPLLPWPLYSDGTPYPAGADGQPDFAAVQRWQEQQAAAQAQFAAQQPANAVPVTPAPPTPEPGQQAPAAEPAQPSQPSGEQQPPQQNTPPTV